MTIKPVVLTRRIFGLFLLTLNLPILAQGDLPPANSSSAGKPDKLFDPVAFFLRHVSPYEPIYFVAGSESPNAKFQFGFKYQLLDVECKVLKGLNVAYTQTSLWDLSAPSAPFFDSSYKPELLYSYDDLFASGNTNGFRLDLQFGAQHESNGKGGGSSRSLNIAYFRPTLTLGRPDGLHFLLQPRFWGYLGDLSDNPDLDEYRGYFDLRAAVVWREFQLSAFGRMGKEGQNHSVQFDLTYLIPKTAIYLDLQYFTGYGESLLRYNQRSDVVRVGFALYR